ncbi:acyltransferase [uncultured Amnibacterium sp.]|uniref:acyltransferase n=1 Tax=uncultured Amnibacterium sp. TaxID=1631851 RepID=UPI0035CC778A
MSAGARGIVSRLLSTVRPQSDAAAAVPVPALLGWYARRGLLPALRGLTRLPLLRSARLPLFVGRGVVIEYGRMLHVGRGVQLGAGLRITALSKHGVHLGDGVTVREQGWIQCSSHPSNPGEGLWIGPRTYIGPRATIGVGGPIRIGSDCQLGANVTLIAENHEVTEEGASAHDVVRRGIRIGDGCWLGHGATVLDGVELGARCIVGAGAVVTRSFPAGTTLVGVPAKPVQTRTDAGQAR